MNNSIIIKGAREHNLSNVSLEIPKNKLVVFTGVSGSGKSSMAFDTIYAEGQRRYVESLSSYARQFLGIMNKPDVDYIEGLSPAISIDQKTRSSNPRSTVGTTTEIYDYLRLLYARIGHVYCPLCHIEISPLSIDEIVHNLKEEIITKVSLHTKPILFYLISPIIRDKKGEFNGLFINLLSKGYTKAIIDKKIVNLEQDLSLIKTNKHSISVIVDTISLSKNQVKNVNFLTTLQNRLYEFCEQGLHLSGGTIELYDEGLTSSTLYSQKLTCLQCGYALFAIEPRMFSFNSPLGACKKCKGLGVIFQIDKNRVINNNLTIAEGAILAFNKLFINETWFGRLFLTFLHKEQINSSIQLKSLPDAQIEKLLYGTNTIYRVEGLNKEGRPTTIHERFRGIIGELLHRYETTSSEFMKEEIEKYMTQLVCPICHGDRLNDESLAIQVAGYSIVKLCKLSILELKNTIEDIKGNKITTFEKKVGEIIFKEIISRLNFLINVGLSYLTLWRPSNTLSGGESQRIRLASQIGSGLSGVIYVLDEPSIGLHPKDVSALLSSLKSLRDLGNTIIIVEHDPETIFEADYIVDFGPKAGKHGGRIMYSGTLSNFKTSNTITSEYLYTKKIDFKDRKNNRKLNSGFITIKGCKQYNLKNISVSIPIGKITCVTGVSGSGKSTLIIDTLYKALKYYIDGVYKDNPGTYSQLDGYQYFNKIYLVDQSPIGKTPRSNPVTYIGVFDEIRNVFALSEDSKIKGFKKGRFSFNVKGGRCEKCQGGGSIKIEMQFLPDVYVQCDVCQGKRYNNETLQVLYKEKTIYDVLSMSVKDALLFFKNHPKIYSKLQTLDDVGLGYLELGQPAPTLSGGEAQRVKLALELSKRNTGSTLYIMDEPTTGLHMYDVEKLLHTLYSLVEKGNTIIIIEHNMEVIKNSDYIIDLGPGGGDKGGEIVYSGDLENLYSVKSSYTAKFLNQYD